MLDNEKLIQCVEKHPPLWDKNSKYYKDRGVRESLWHNIGNQMFSEWQNLNEEQKQDKIMYMKSKWHNLRDALMRCIRQNEVVGKKKRYVYEDLLSFLLIKSSSKRRAYKRKSEDEEDDMQNSEDELDQLDDTLLTPKNEAEDEIEIDETNLIDMSPKAQGIDRLIFEPSQFSPDQSDLTIKEEEDGDKSFLMSLLPDMRKLDDDQRLDFRFHCLQFFRDLQQRNGGESKYETYVIE